MSGALTLEEIGADSIASVMEVMDDAFDPAFGEAWTTPQCLGILGLPGVWLTLARVDGAPAGFTLCRIILDEAELLLLGVRPARRRIGIGSILLKRAAAVALVQGARTLHLEVRSGNDALALYGRAGFVQVGQRNGYYRGKDGQLFDALSLSVSLLDGNKA